MATNARPLDELGPGEGGTIRRLDGAPEVRHRLQEMGLTRGTSVRLVRVAPWGDPIELQVRGYRLSLRRSEAASVLIEVHHS